MDHQEDFSTPSRAEYIKLARESCTRNLNAPSWSSKNNGKMKDEDKESRFSLFKKKDIPDYYSFTQGEFDIPNSSMRLFLIRAVCAFMLFLTIFIIDKLNIEFKGISSKSIKQLVSSNQGIEDAENFFVSLFDKEKVKNSERDENNKYDENIENIEDNEKNEGNVNNKSNVSNEDNSKENNNSEENNKSNENNESKEE
jgi:hypothetical protein